jgi:hypothetical protein
METPLSLIADTLSEGSQVYLDGKVSDEFARQREIFFTVLMPFSLIKQLIYTRYYEPQFTYKFYNSSDTIVFIIVCFTSRVYIRRLKDGPAEHTADFAPKRP